MFRAECIRISSATVVVINLLILYYDLRILLNFYMTKNKSFWVNLHY